MSSNHLTLAITRIGDLLLNEKITVTQQNTPLENVVLTVPEYQRPYKWTPQNAIQLLDDILEAKALNKEVYRVGTLILHRETKEGVTTYAIVDGQQRIITFALLLLALGEEQEISFLNETLADNPHNRKNVPTNFLAFQRRLKGNEKEDIHANELLKSFVEEQCEMVVVITDDLSEAFQFFDSQNSRGKSLYPHDLLKAYHLREMAQLSEEETDRTVQRWEEHSQSKLADLFGNYLYYLKEWTNGNRANILNESNLHLFKGITQKDCTPYAQFYKAAYAYAEEINRSPMPFVAGIRPLCTFQLNAPIIAGKPFFDFTQHYISILHDIQDNSKYEGFYIKDHPIVKTLDTYYHSGSGNYFTRVLFDTALLLYVDRFCPATYPSQNDLEMFERFVVYAFIWAYSLRAQYERLQWEWAQNYILSVGTGKDKTNSCNLYQIIVQSDSPARLLGTLDNCLQPLTLWLGDKEKEIDLQENGIYKNYLHFFKIHHFLLSNHE